MRGMMTCWLTLLVAAMSAAADPPPSIDLAWRERARTEGRAAYEKYVETAKRLEEVVELRHDHKTDPGSAFAKTTYPPHTRRDRFVRVGDDVILERTRTIDGSPDAPQTFLQCDNAEYHFRLRKEPAGYALVDYELGPRKVPLRDQGGGIHEGAFSRLGWALRAIDGADKHTLKAIHWDESKKLLRIVGTDQRGDDIDTTEVWVDPKHNWRVEETRVETKYLVGTEVMTYGIPIAGLDFPTAISDRSTYKVIGAPPEMKITGRVISLKVADRGPEGFRLSAFGLPEPVDAPTPLLPKGTPLYVWLLAGAAALGLLAAGFRYLARHRTASSPA